MSDYSSLNSAMLEPRQPISESTDMNKVKLDDTTPVSPAEIKKFLVKYLICFFNAFSLTFHVFNVFRIVRTFLILMAMLAIDCHVQSFIESGHKPVTKTRLSSTKNPVCCLML